jgi:hypothetical protein
MYRNLRDEPLPTTNLNRNRRDTFLNVAVGVSTQNPPKDHNGEEDAANCGGWVGEYDGFVSFHLWRCDDCDG